MSYEFKNPVIKYFEHSSIADSGSFSQEWDTDDEYVLRHIFIKADGARTTKSTITVWVGNMPLTKDKCLCNTFGTNPEDALLFNMRIAKGVKIKYEGVNKEGATKDFTVELVFDRA